MKEVSVLVCVHSNDTEHDTMLYKALDSLYRQTYKDFEVVVVLDECRPSTAVICGCFKDKLDIKTYFRDKKEGLASAKNFGIEKCSGEYIAYLDADDEWMDCKLEVQLDYLNKHRDIDFLFTNAWDRLADGIWRPNCFKVTDYEDHASISQRLPLENILCHGSLLTKKENLIDLGGYNTREKFLGMEDWELWLRALTANYKFGKVPERLYIYSLGTSVER